MVFGMIHVKDSLLPWGKVWPLGFLGLIVLVKLARDLTRRFSPQKVAFWKGNPLISGKCRLVKYYNLARLLVWGPVVWIPGIPL